MASIVDKIVTNVSVGIENAIHFLSSFFSSQETEVEVKTNLESGELHFFEPEEVKAELDDGAPLNIAEILLDEDSPIFLHSASGNNASVLDPLLLSVTVPVNQLPEISLAASDF